MDDHDWLAPEGTYCRFHPERPALARCPRCGDYVCIACWHSVVDRCNACLQRNPSEAAPPIPWEDPQRGLVSRFFGTLATAFRPMATAPGFARESLGPAFVFALLTAVPLALLKGVMPFTETLRFGSAFSVEVLNGADGRAIAIDVLRACGISLGLTLVYFVALTVPFVSLSRAYGSGRYPHAALRAMLYRGWLLALSMQGAPFFFVWWAAPAGSELLASVLQIVDLIPLVLLFVSMRATARLGHGVGPFATLAVVLVPLTLMVLLHGLSGTLLAPFVPQELVAPAEETAEPQGETQSNASPSMRDPSHVVATNR